MRLFIHLAQLSLVAAPQGFTEKEVFSKLYVKMHAGITPVYIGVGKYPALFPSTSNVVMMLASPSYLELDLEICGFKPMRHAWMHGRWVGFAMPPR